MNPTATAHRPVPCATPPPLAALARPTALARGAYLYRPGDRLERVYLLREGLVKVGGYGPAGAEVVYDVVRAGEFCGDLKYLGGDRFQEFARALTPVVATTYDLAAFRRLVRDDAAVHEWFVPLMVGRWARAEGRLFRIAALSPAERLAALLGELEVGGVDARAVLTQTDLAHLTGLARQTVARLLPTLG